MQIISLVNGKGGAGKSTLAAHLAVEAAKHGKTAILDLDPQASLADWFNAREVKDAPAYANAADGLHAAVDGLRTAGFAFLICDTAGTLEDGSIDAAVEVADIVLIPTRPSPVDLRPLGRTISRVTAYSTPLVFVVNGAQSRAKLTGEAAISLSQHGTVAPSIIHHRNAYAVAMITGQTAQEIEPSGKAAAEIASLFEYVQGRMAA